MKIESHTPKDSWIHFNRIHCKEGWIDYCYLDSACDPNSNRKPTISLNNTISWIRQRYGLWYPLGRSAFSHLSPVRELCDIANSNEIWEAYYIDLEYEPYSKENFRLDTKGLNPRKRKNTKKLLS